MTSLVTARTRTFTHTTQINCSCRHRQSRAALVLPKSFQYEALTQEQRAQVGTFIDYLLEENTKYNLTAVRDRDAAHERHVLDSLTLLDVIDKYVPDAAQQALNVLDVGSGPGLPGIILAIARPNWTVTCLDSLQKRMRFVDAAAQATSLLNVRTVWGRCEDLGHDNKLRGRFDVVTARAVASTDVLAEYCLPFVKTKGIWVASKGSVIEEEVAAGKAAIRLLGGRLITTELVDSFSADGQRTALVVRKTDRTNSWLPRKPGVPKKTPLKQKTSPLPRGNSKQA